MKQRVVRFLAILIVYLVLIAPVLRSCGVMVPEVDIAGLVQVMVGLVQ